MCDRSGLGGVGALIDGVGYDNPGLVAAEAPVIGREVSGFEIFDLAAYGYAECHCIQVAGAGRNLQVEPRLVVHRAERVNSNCEGGGGRFGAAGPGNIGEEGSCGLNGYIAVRSAQDTGDTGGASQPEVGQGDIDVGGVTCVHVVGVVIDKLDQGFQRHLGQRHVKCHHALEVGHLHAGHCFGDIAVGGEQ